MIIIQCEGKKIETCLKKYRQKLDRVGQTAALKSRKEYEKPSAKKRRERAQSEYRRRHETR